MDKLLTYIDKWKDLPEQKSEQWLADRTHTIGGSEMGTIAGCNPYKKIRDLIQTHIGLKVFNGSINTYWGSILEDLVTIILEDVWHTKIYEAGSLPGVVEGQKYSPDGLMYLEWLDQIVLIEIKSPARRVVNGKIPRMYKPQVYTGLDTIPIANFAIFVDAMFRRCSLEDHSFTATYDTQIHPDKPLGVPHALCMVGIFEQQYTGTYDDLQNLVSENELLQDFVDDYNLEQLKSKQGESSPPQKYVDIGACSPDVLEAVLKDVTRHKLSFYFPQWTSDEKISSKDMIKDYEEYCDKHNYIKVAVMPLKLFRCDIIPVSRDEWRKERKINKNSKSYVHAYEEVIHKTLQDIKYLSTLDKEKQVEELDKLYPPKNKPMPPVDSAIEQDLINSLL